MAASTASAERIISYTMPIKTSHTGSRRPSSNYTSRPRPADLCVNCQGDSIIDDRFIKRYSHAGPSSIGHIRVPTGRSQDTFDFRTTTLSQPATATASAIDPHPNQSFPRYTWGYKDWIRISGHRSSDSTANDASDSSRQPARGRQKSSRDMPSSSNADAVPDMPNMSACEQGPDCTHMQETSDASDTISCTGPPTSDEAQNVPELSHSATPSPRGSLRRITKGLPVRAAVLDKRNDGHNMGQDFWRSVMEVQNAVINIGSGSSADVLDVFLREGPWQAGKGVCYNQQPFDLKDTEQLCQLIGSEAEKWAKPL